MRPKGVVTYRSPVNKFALAAEQHQKQLQEQKRAKAAARAAIPIPNRLCYAETAFKDWKPGMPVPKCWVCESLLHPEENHVCEGFTPKYVEHDEAWHERQDAKREEIRASKQRVRRCSGCGDELHSLDDARYHDEYCEAEHVRARHAVNGDEDDLSGYEDEPEEDYCEGDDDGYDCD